MALDLRTPFVRFIETAGSISSPAFLSRGQRGGSIVWKTARLNPFYADRFFGVAQAGVSGTSAVTLAGVTQAAQGAVAVKGSGAATLAGVSQAAQGAVAIAGTGVATLAGVTQVAQGAVAVKGNGTTTLTGITQAAGGAVAAKGNSAVTLDGVTQTASGQVGIAAVQGNGAAVLAGVSQTGAGQVAVSGAGFAILQGIVQLGQGTVGIAGPAAIAPYDWQPPVVLATSAIIGQALRFMRQSPVARLDPGSEILPALTDAFSRAIDECLDAADWSFASTLAVLPGSALPAAAIADDALPHAYQLPGDLIRLRRVGDAATRWRSDAGVLRCSAAAPLMIRYTARVTRETALPATFQAAVALQIAALLGARWAGGVIAGDDIAMQAVMTLKQAMREDSRHAAAERALAAPDLRYSPADDWALEALT